MEENWDQGKRGSGYTSQNNGESSASERSFTTGSLKDVELSRHHLPSVLSFDKREVLEKSLEENEHLRYRTPSEIDAERIARNNREGL